MTISNTDRDAHVSPTLIASHIPSLLRCTATSYLLPPDHINNGHRHPVTFVLLLPRFSEYIRSSRSVPSVSTSRWPYSTQTQVSTSTMKHRVRYSGSHLSRQLYSTPKVLVDHDNFRLQQLLLYGCLQHEAPAIVRCCEALKRVVDEHPKILRL